MTDSLRVWWKLPELSDRLTMLVIVGTRSADCRAFFEKPGRNRIRIYCLLGQLNKICANISPTIDIVLAGCATDKPTFVKEIFVENEQCITAFHLIGITDVMIYSF